MSSRQPIEASHAALAGLRLAARERIAKAINLLQRTRFLNRADIERIGEVSTSQASYDIREILNRFQSLMVYDKHHKCYVL